jgi:hypothetical protein
LCCCRLFAGTCYCEAALCFPSVLDAWRGADSRANGRLSPHRHQPTLSSRPKRDSVHNGRASITHGRQYHCCYLSVILNNSLHNSTQIAQSYNNNGDLTFTFTTPVLQSPLNLAQNLTPNFTNLARLAIAPSTSGRANTPLTGETLEPRRHRPHPRGATGGARRTPERSQQQ